MHTRGLYFIHRRHHVSHVTHPLTALSFSLSERAIYHAGIFLGVLGVACIRPVPIVSLMGFFVATGLLNAAVHCNFEIVPAWVVRSPLGRVAGSVSFHAMHHARAANHYGFTTSLLDHVFGTVWPDYERVHARAVAGDGLATLGERVAVVPGLATSRT
jgi:sterol desaturase/sphingolipid hydroxylase (fatty acid hydroxylase superfamily)